MKVPWNIRFIKKNSGDFVVPDLGSWALKDVIHLHYRRLRDRDHRVYEGAESGDPLCFSAEDLGALIHKDLSERVCRYCGGDLHTANMSVDHIQALSAGGRTTLENLQVICPACNMSKGSMSDREFRLSGKLIRRKFKVRENKAKNSLLFPPARKLAGLRTSRESKEEEIDGAK